MLSVTKIFTFEMAHALYNYKGPCSNIHGHSYILHVTVKSTKEEDSNLIPPGFIIDFKELKEIVSSTVISLFDHKLVLSTEYVNAIETGTPQKNLFRFEEEPTAENLILFISKKLIACLPDHVALHSLKLFETSSSYAEWKDESN